MSGWSRHALSARRDRLGSVMGSCLVLVLTGIALFNLSHIPIGSRLGPAPDAPSYALGAESIMQGEWTRVPFVGERGEDPSVTTPRYPSRYPPGFPATLAAVASPIGGDLSAVWTASRILVGALLVAVVLLAFLLYDWKAAAIAALVSCTSPFLQTSMTIIMADAFAALITVIVALLITIRRRVSARDRCRIGIEICLGCVIALGILTKLSLVLLVIPVIYVIIDRRAVSWRAAFRAVTLVLLPVACGLLLLGAHQRQSFGDPFETGYAHWVPGIHEFDYSYLSRTDIQGDDPYIYRDRLEGRFVAWVEQTPTASAESIRSMPSFLIYTAVLAGAYWIYFPPAFSMFGVYWLFLRRRRREARAMMIIIIIFPVFFSFYFFEGSRFVAPSAMVLLPIASAGAALALDRILFVRLRRR